jgi:tetratricopeptide (TPR) repeat protein
MDVQKIRKDILAMAYDDPDVALERMNMLVAEMPGELWVLQLRASVHEVKGDVEKAFEDLDEVIKIRPSEPSPYFKKAGIYVDVEKYGEAISEFTKTINLGKNIKFSYFNGYSYLMRAFCYCKIGDFESARLDLDYIDDDMHMWTDPFWTKEDIVKACSNKRIS